ncbi:MAG: tRNA lysidine(34) synthetase TilS [Pseudomonadota bacterium]
MSFSDVDICSVIRSQFLASPPSRLGVAVSGGSDSLALLHSLSRCFAQGSVALHAVTVDHGLRPEAAQEAAQVAAFADSLGLPHTTLQWDGWNGQGNLQACARDARYRLIGEWARANKIASVATGHTADDQAETVVMRLARSSGVNGLSAMSVRRTLHGVSIVRPMLGLTRKDLRAYLRRQGISWTDDPSNDDLRFERIQVRQALEHLDKLGVSVSRLAEVAGNMGEAREALDWYTFVTARDIACVKGGDVVVDLRRFRTLPREIARRLILNAVRWIGRADYPPRRSAMGEAIDAIRRGRGTTLGGCRIVVSGTSIWICREFAAARAERAQPGQLWDGRWTLFGPVDQGGLHIAALGQRGLETVPDWRDTGVPSVALLASPGVWQGDELVAAPLAGWSNGWRADLHESAEAFFAALLSN